MVIRGPKQTVVRELPDVLAEPFCDPELYWTREARQALRTALLAEEQSMAAHGFPAQGFHEAIGHVDDVEAVPALTP